MEFNKDFDTMIELIRTERDRLKHELSMIGADDLDEVTRVTDAFKSSVLPVIQTFTDALIGWVSEGDINEVQTLQSIVDSTDEMTYLKFRALVRQYADNYFCNRYLYTIAFLHDFDRENLVEPVNSMYSLLVNLFDRCRFLVGAESLNDDSLERFSILFHGMM